MNIRDRIKAYLQKTSRTYDHHTTTTPSTSAPAVPRITIIQRHDGAQPERHRRSGNASITIRNINKRTAPISGTLAEGSGQQTDLGNGITMKRQRKPNRCPICATTGKIEANADGRNKWLCKACGHTFN